jgi:hypothetical protein
MYDTDDWSAFFSTVSAGVKTANDVLSLINRFKQIGARPGAAMEPAPSIHPGVAQPGLPPMQPFAPAAPDPFAGGAQWLPYLQQLAGQFGNAWVPAQTSGLFGIDLTGVWAPPMNPMEQTYLRQSGPYLNLITGLAGTPLALAEGIFIPRQSAIFVVGRYATGAPFQAQAQLMPDWTHQGMLAGTNPIGMPFQMPLYMRKIA